MPKRRKRFSRKPCSCNFVPDKTTKRILISIHAYEGVMTQNQINRLCFPGLKSPSWPLQQMQHYYDHKLVKKHDAYNVNGRYLKEIIYTLETKGAMIAAREEKIDWSALKWRKSPRWITLIHDLTINDIHLSFVEACQNHDAFSLERWVSEYELSQVSPRIPGRLDGFFILRRKNVNQSGRIEQLALHLEIDTGNHPINRLLGRKVKPILKYFGSAKYVNHFGVQDGACLFVTTSEKRLRNVKKAIEESGGAGLFYLTTLDAISSDTVLTKPIWMLTGSDYLFSIENIPLSPVEAGVLNDATNPRLVVQERLFV